MGNNPIIREYENGDESHILELFRIVFKRDLGEEFWRWRYIDNPFGKGIIRLMFDGEKLIGHYAVIPIPLSILGKTIKAAFSMTTMTHPDYQGRGIFTSLASDVYRHCREMGIGVVFGFPNQNSYYGFTEKLGWLGLGNVTSLDAERSLRPMGSSGDYLCLQVSDFDGALDMLWERVKDTYKIIVPRDSTYLNWRYCEDPENEYTVYILRDNNESVQGYIVLKIFNDGKTRVGHIVDIIAAEGEQAVKELLNTAHTYFQENDVDRLSSWIPRDSYIYTILKELGYREKIWNTYFGVKSLCDDDMVNRILEKKENWWLTMGDSDVF